MTDLPSYPGGGSPEPYPPAGQGGGQQPGPYPGGQGGGQQPGPYPGAQSPPGGSPPGYPGGQYPPGGSPPGYPGGQYPGGPPPYPPGEPYPGGPTPPMRPPVPPTVVNAVRLMYVGAALSVIEFVLALALTSNIRSSLRHALPSATTASINNDLHAVQVLIVIEAVIEVGLWVWMAWANRGGRNWARILSTVLFGISTISMVLNIAQHSGAFLKVLPLLIWLVGLAVIVLLWRRESSAYFKPQRAQAW